MQNCFYLCIYTLQPAELIARVNKISTVSRTFLLVWKTAGAHVSTLNITIGIREVISAIKTVLTPVAKTEFSTKLPNPLLSLAVNHVWKKLSNTIFRLTSIKIFEFKLKFAFCFVSTYLMPMEKRLLGAVSEGVNSSTKA